MANSRSARKRIRANERKHLRNRGVRSAVRTKVGKARRAIVGVDDTVDLQEQVTTAVSALDKAAEKGILHRRNAARRKSRLMAMAHRIAVAAEAGDEALAAARATALGGEKGRKASVARPRAAAAVAAEPAAEAAETPAKGPGRSRARSGGEAPATTTRTRARKS